MKTRLAATLAAFALLAACSITPTPADRDEEGVKAALTEWVETALHGNMSADMTKRYCEELVTKRARESAAYLCAGKPAVHTNPTWKDIDSIDSISITGDTATITWWWHGQDSTGRTQTTDTFIFEERRWKHDN